MPASIPSGVHVASTQHHISEVAVVMMSTTCTGFISSRALRAAHDRIIDRMFTPL